MSNASCLLVVVALVATIAIGAINNTSDTLLFRACLGTLLSLFGCAQLFAALSLYLNRNNSLLELSQPVALSVFCTAGATATIASFLFALPENDVACSMRQPIILTSITVMGYVLVARSWRISGILSPASNFASAARNNSQPVTLQVVAKMKLMKLLTRVSEWTLFLGSCGKIKTGGNKGLVKKITFAASMRVTAVLVLPQLILQIINLSVPAFRVESIEIDDSMHACECAAGPALLIVGIVFAVVPFFLALLLNVESGSLPEIFREYDQITSSMRISTGMLLVTLPAIAMVSHTITNAHAYLMVASVLSFVLPICYNITSIWTKMCTFRFRAKKNRTAKRRESIPNALRRTSLNSKSNAKRDNLETLCAADDALTIAEMFESMGNGERAIEVYIDVLSMFKSKEERYDANDGFTGDEINNFGPKTVALVVSALISSSKRFGDCFIRCQDEKREEYKHKLVKSGVDALHIFDKAPAKHLLTDRSAVFPGFSLVAQLMKGGLVTSSHRNGQSPAQFENTLASNFVSETQFSLFHYCRALAMKADILSKLNLFDDALRVIEDLKRIFDPAIHSKAISKLYSYDHCSGILSVSSLWLYHLDRKEEASEQCNYIMGRILPNMEKKSNMMGLPGMFAPIMQVIRRTQGAKGTRRVQELFNEHVASIFNDRGGNGSQATFFYRIMEILLKCHISADDSHSCLMECDGMEDDIAWIMSKEILTDDRVESTWAESINLSVYALLAEICLCMAKGLGIGHKQKSALIEEGLRLSDLAETKMQSKEGGTLVIAYTFHSCIHSELRSLSVAKT